MLLKFFAQLAPSHSYLGLNSLTSHWSERYFPIILSNSSFLHVCSIILAHLFFNPSTENISFLFMCLSDTSFYKASSTKVVLFLCLLPSNYFLDEWLAHNRFSVKQIVKTHTHTPLKHPLLYAVYPGFLHSHSSGDQPRLHGPFLQCTHILWAVPARIFLCAFYFDLPVCFSRHAVSKSEGKYTSCSFFCFCSCCFFKYFISNLNTYRKVAKITPSILLYLSPYFP